MLFKEKENFYPVMDGNAFVRVNLNNREQTGLLERTVKSLQYGILNWEVGNYFYPAIYPGVPKVHLREDLHRRDLRTAGRLEWNLFADSLSPLQKLQIALGGVVTAGLIFISTWGVLHRDNAPIIPPSRVNVESCAVSGEEIRELPPVIMVDSGNSDFVLASLNNPSDRHPFRTLGHINTGGEHTNSGGVTHSNVDYTPSTSLRTDVTSTETPHTNTDESHTNDTDWSGEPGP